MRIGIALPLGKTVDGKFVSSFVNILKENLSVYDIDILTHTDIYVDRARNELVKKAIVSKCDYVWFLDTDHIFPQGTLTRLLKLMKDKNADIVSGLYFTRTPPVIPVIRKYVDDTYEPIFDYSGVIEVDGIGFGCCLIKTELFKKLEFPYFDGKYEERYGFQGFIGEDLYFCRNIRKLGIKIYVDTDLIIQHIGGLVNDQDFLPHKQDYLKSEQIKGEIIDDLSEYTQIPKGQVKSNLLNGCIEFKKEWEQANPLTKEDREKVYTNSYWEKYELANWHLSGRLNFDVNLVEMIKKKYPNKEISILDYGCGIGQNSLLLAKEGYSNITLYDLNTEFAEFRFKKHNLAYKKVFSEQYDLILCFDVLEHLDDEEFKSVTNFLKSHTKQDGEILMTVSFGDNGLHPMHFAGSKEKIKTIKNLMKNAKVS